MPTAKRQNASETYDWLTARTRHGRRIAILGWKRLARIWDNAPAGSRTRRAIAAEARRCGYKPTTILACNR